MDVDLLPHPVARLAADGTLDDANAAWRAAFGTGQLSLIGLVGRDERRLVHEWLDGGSPPSAALRLTRAGGDKRWYRLHAVQAGSDHREWIVSVADVDGMVRAGHGVDAQLAARDDMLDVSVDCIKIIDLEGRVLHMNRSGRTALGVSDAEAAAGFGMPWLSLLPPDIARRGRRALRRAREGSRARFAGMSVAPSGAVQHWDNLLTPLLEEGVPTSILCVSREVTRQREAAARLRRASETDHLTGLLNRRSFDTRLPRALARARQDGSQLGVALLDLDHFKHVNDTLGHAAGDRLLRAVAGRITARLPVRAFAARLGGDEIGFVLEGVTDRAAFHELVTAIIAEASRPVGHKGRTLAHSMSVGCAVFPADAPDETGLMACADAALGEVKASGRGGVALFEPEMLRASQSTASQLETGREVVRGGLVVPVYQPQVRLDTGELVGFEALLRWRRGSELVPPSTLDAAFEDFDLASGLGVQMHDAVIADLASWIARGQHVVPVALNVAPVELLRGDFATSLLARLERAGVPPSAIRLEVTERALGARGAEIAIATLRRLRDAGVAIVLDDFGTGHASLTRLTEYPVTVVKVDRSFVAPLGDDRGGRSAVAIVTAVVALGHALDAEVVAEGVETSEQRRLLLGAGCQVGQGHLLGLAVEADEVATTLVRHESAMHERLCSD